MAETQTSIKDVIPEIGGNFELDNGVIDGMGGDYYGDLTTISCRETDHIVALPPDCHVVEATTYGTAAWTRAARVTVELKNGAIKTYFLKCASEEQGKIMMEGEYRSMKEIEQYLPTFVPRPCAWGCFKNAPVPTYFFLLEFLDLNTGIVDPAAFCLQLVKLHRGSLSPTGKFGFDVTTCHGPNAQDTNWHDDWCFYFTRLLRQFFDREIRNNGPDEEYEDEFERLVTTTIPQILEPLQRDGRVPKPSLIHGDLWEENAGTELGSGYPVVFDAAAHYAHNEFELGMWRRDVVRFGRLHIRQYLRLMPPSEPKEQWDDRNRLYSIKYDLAHSIALPGTCDSQRQLIMDNMRFLNTKYGAGGH